MSAQPQSPPSPLIALLNRVAERLGVESIDELWIFPARQIPLGETAVVVVSVFHADPERRRVFTGHYTARREDGGGIGVQERFEEQAVAPAERIRAVVEGVLARLDDELAAAPRSVRIRGAHEAWTELLVDLAGL